MLVLKILATIFVSISIITGIIKNALVCEENNSSTSTFIVASLYSILWRALVIVALWVIQRGKIMSFWVYNIYDDMRFFKEQDADKRQDKFIKSKMMKRNRKLKGNKRGR